VVGKGSERGISTVDGWRASLARTFLSSWCHRFLATSFLNTTFSPQATLPLAKTSCDLPRPLPDTSITLLACSPHLNMSDVIYRSVLNPPTKRAICMKCFIQPASTDHLATFGVAERDSRGPEVIRSWSGMVEGGEGDALWWWKAQPSAPPTVAETVCDFGTMTAASSTSYTTY
jgi:hypothetical protein